MKKLVLCIAVLLLALGITSEPMLSAAAASNYTGETGTLPGGYVAKNSAYELEKSIIGTYGYTPYPINMEKANGSKSKVVVSPTEPFVILGENKTKGRWWIRYGNHEGAVPYAHLMVNLPQVMPSAEYNITNASASIYKIGNKNIPNTTGAKLYHYHANKIAPINYSVAAKVWRVQQAAMKDNYSLLIYDTYRPYEVQATASDEMIKMVDNKEITKSDMGSWWNYSSDKSDVLGFFMTPRGKINGHQTGTALDVSLCDKNTREEFSMPSEMHDLSNKGTKFSYETYRDTFNKVPYVYNSDDYKNKYVDTMKNNKYAKWLDAHFTYNGEGKLCSLVSEWWHFQDHPLHLNIASNVKKTLAGQLKEPAYDEAKTPSLLSAEVKASASGSVQVSWENTTDAYWYRVYREVDGKWKGIGDYDSASCIDDGSKYPLKSGETYKYTVKAINEPGEAATSRSEYDKNGVTTQFFEAPKLSSATNVADGIKLSWNSTPAAVAYRIYRSDPNSTRYTKFESTQNTFTDTTAKENVTYTYLVRCLDKVGGKTVSGYYSDGITVKREIPTVKMGDVNLDGVVNIKDATLVQKAIAKLVNLSDAQRLAADLNKDGTITIIDVTLIQKKIAQIQ